MFDSAFCKSDLLGGNRIEVLTRLEDTVVARSSLHIVAFHILVGSGTVLDVSAETDVGILGCIVLIELMPANEIPVAEVAVEHKLAAAAATYLPYKAVNAHVVGGVFDSLKRSDCLVRQTGAGIKLVDRCIEIGVGKSAEFGLGFSTISDAL